VFLYTEGFGFPHRSRTRVSVADGAHLTEFATKFPHFEGLHLQNTALFGEDTRVILYAYSCIFCFSWIFSVPFLFLDFLTVVW